MAMISTLFKLTSFISLVFTANAYALESIGDILIQKGNAVIVHNTEDKIATEGLDIFSYDVVKTGNGRTAIEFVDDTRVDVTEHSKLIIDEFVYDPNTKVGSLAIKAGLGTIRYASGQIAKSNPQKVLISTPTAVIGVRGTDFSMTVDELGSSTIILLPSCDTNGNCYVGEISVESDAGQVILNQAFQATVVSTFESRPMKPVLLELTEDMIGNLLIVSRPKAFDDYEEFQERANALDIDFLEFEIKVDYLEEDEEQWETGLDVDFLEQNFLVDILDQINEELAAEMRDEFTKQRTTGAVVTGRNEVSGVVILDDNDRWLYQREGSSNYLQLRLDKDYGYVISFVQGDVEVINDRVGEGTNNIYIYQSN